VTLRPGRVGAGTIATIPRHAREEPTRTVGDARAPPLGGHGAPGAVAIGVAVLRVGPGRGHARWPAGAAGREHRR
jgi:hypothetical protein